MAFQSGNPRKPRNVRQYRKRTTSQAGGIPSAEEQMRQLDKLTPKKFAEVMRSDPSPLDAPRERTPQVESSDYAEPDYNSSSPQQVEMEETDRPSEELMPPGAADTGETGRRARRVESPRTAASTDQPFNYVFSDASGSAGGGESADQKLDRIIQLLEQQPAEIVAALRTG